MGPTAKQISEKTAAWGKFILPSKRDSSTCGKLCLPLLLPSCFGTLLCENAMMTVATILNQKERERNAKDHKVRGGKNLGP